MNLDELRKSMATLDDVFAQNKGVSINFNLSTCDTAQRRIMRRYKRYAFLCAILMAVFLTAWSAGLGEDAFPKDIKIFLGACLATEAIWDAYLCCKTKKINIADSTSLQILRQASSLRLYALAGEIVLGIAIAVFLTLFLSNLWTVGRSRFWVCTVALAICVIYIIVRYIPMMVRDFRNLTATE